MKFSKEGIKFPDPDDHIWAINRRRKLLLPPIFLESGSFIEITRPYEWKPLLTTHTYQVDF